MSFFKWSRTAASNGTADPSCPFPEGMAPSALNDGNRGQMAALRKFGDDISGAIVTGGTLNAYTVASYQGFTALATDLNGQMIAFSPHVTNGDTVTLNVDGLGAKPLRSAPGVELVAGTLVQGTPYIALYNHADLAFYLRGYFSSPYNVPFLGGMDFWDTISPNSSFIFPAGQAISRTVYSRAFARWGTTYGIGDGSTTFNVPDKTGRVSAMKEAVATRLTTAAVGVDGATMGAAGGGSQTLLTANLPAYTPSGSVALTNGTIVVRDPGGLTTLTHSVSTPTAQVIGLSGAVYTLTAAFTGIAQGGTSTPVKIAQPTIVCNYIIRII